MYYLHVSQRRASRADFDRGEAGGKAVALFVILFFIFFSLECVAILEHEEGNRAGLFKNSLKRATTIYSWLYCSCVTIMILFNCVVLKSVGYIVCVTMFFFFLIVTFQNPHF